MNLATLVGSLLAPPPLHQACAVQMPVDANGSSVGDWSVCCATSTSDVGKRLDPCVVVSIGIGGTWLFEDALAYAGCEVHAFDPTIELES